MQGFKNDRTRLPMVLVALATEFELNFAKSFVHSDTLPNQIQECYSVNEKQRPLHMVINTRPFTCFN